MNIYKITNSINDLFYYGRTNGHIEDRFYRHLEDARRGCDTNLHKAMREIGLDKWKTELVCTCPNFKILKKVESALIKKFNPNLDPEVSYNMTYEEDGFVCHSSDSLLKMSGENNHMFNKVHINNGIINTAMIKGGIIPNGFKLGMKKLGIKSFKFKGRNYSSKGMINKIHINNGTIGSTISLGEKLPNGFKFGMKPRLKIRLTKSRRKLINSISLTIFTN